MDLQIKLYNVFFITGGKLALICICFNYEYEYSFAEAGKLGFIHTYENMGMQLVECIQ